jgi:cell wall-associated NlpC family hydrolase
MPVDRNTRETRTRGERYRFAAFRAVTLAHGRRTAVHWALALAALACCAAVLLTYSSPATATPPTGGVRLSGDAKAQVSSLSAQAQAVQAEIDVLDQQLEENTEAYNRMRVQLDELNIEMMGLRRELDVAQNDYQYRLDKYEDRLRELYKTGGTDAFLEMVLASGSVDDFVACARVAAQLAQQDRALLENLQAAADRLDAILVEVDQAKSQELVIRGQMNDQRDQITAALTERQTALAGIDSQITAIIEAARIRQAAEQERLRQALAQLLNGGQVYNGQLPQTDNEILAQFLHTAATYIGLPYVWAGDRPSTGMDCSGYTQFVYRQHGVNLPHYSGYQAQMGLPVSYGEMRPGDLLAFGFPVHHVGIYIGDDLFIHAAGTGDTIHISVLSERGDLAAIRRFDLQARTGEPAFY